MEENMNYIFNEKVGDVQCKFDGKLWFFKNADSNEEMAIPVKSISNVQLTKVNSRVWLIGLVLALVIEIAGVYFEKNGIWLFYEEEGVWLFHGLAILFGIIAIIALFFSVEYTISIIPHSKVEQRIVTRKKNVLKNLYEALVNSLRKNC